MEEKIAQLLEKLTLEEKVSLLAGADMWTTVPVERVGIPKMKVSDGPNGARGNDMGGDATSACFPVGIALGATWNTELVQEVGKALASEIRDKGAHILLAPTVNIHRGVLNGRNFECYAEDPYLSAQLAAAYIKGVQSKGVAACVKHFVCNDSEFQRNSMSSDVSERALHEIYLPPFKTAVQEAKSWTVMSSYNRVNGTFVSENPLLLRDILKDEWGFDGAVMSDWWGSYSSDAAAGGLDLEMPGPARHLGPHLVKMVQNGELAEAHIDDKVRRILRTMLRTGVFERPATHDEVTNDRPETRALIRKAGAEAIVLLKNENNLLPLSERKVRSIAVIGANAKWTPIMGGGSAKVAAHYAISHLAGITAVADDKDIDVKYAIGTPSNFKLLPMLEPSWITAWTADIFSNHDLEGQPAATQATQKVEIFPMNDMPAGIGDAFSIRYTATLTPPESGSYNFSLVSGGLSRVLVAGQTLVDNWTEHTKSELYYGQGSTEVREQITLQAGKPVELVVEYSSRQAGLRVWRLGCLPPLPQNSIEVAAQLAAECDVAVVFAGLSGDWESESYDRLHMDLPGEQDALITAVTRANPNTVVVLNTGSPVSMPWIDDAPAVLETWYGGQESGNALADVLFGEAEPGGRLPQTFPMRLQDNPTFLNYPGENGHVLYGEGIFVGYRYYEKKEIAPLFPFGHGLSYTEFEYSNLRLGSEFSTGDTISVTLDVKNTGSRAGQEVVQVYVCDLESKLTRPSKELKAFHKVSLQPGETQTVTVTLDESSLVYYDPAKPGWVSESGEFKVLIGHSSQEIRLSGQFTWHGDTAVAATFDKSARLHVGLTLGELLDDPDGNAIITKHLGNLLEYDEAKLALNYSLEQMAVHAPQFISTEKLHAINAELVLC